MKLVYVVLILSVSASEFHEAAIERGAQEYISIQEHEAILSEVLKAHLKGKP